MKRIVILCDGTWNRSDSRNPTNVVRFAKALNARDPEGVVQVPIYIQGVGTGRGPTGSLRKLDSLLGGAFGLGLMPNIEEAYRHLVFLYEPGDEVFVLGFSRGAYTARSLAGLIRATGIIERDALHRLPEALARYRTMDDPTTRPSHPESHEFRARMSPRVVTSVEEAAWRRERGMPEALRFRIRYLGVWDTVGTLGVPAFVPVIGPLVARRYRFHDADLSSMVISARHALALDERRRAFEPTRWKNLDDLNAGAGGSGAPSYQELFFAGDHGSVGGGGDLTDLSHIGLEWIIEGARLQRLSFDDGHLTAIERGQDPMGPLRSTREKPGGPVEWLTRLCPRDREGPAKVTELHATVVTRWTRQPFYRPGSLARLQGDLAELRSPTDPRKSAATPSECDRAARST